MNLHVLLMRIWDQKCYFWVVGSFVLLLPLSCQGEESLGARQTWGMRGGRHDALGGGSLTVLPAVIQGRLVVPLNRNERLGRWRFTTGHEPCDGAGARLWKSPKADAQTAHMRFGAGMGVFVCSFT